jgi:ribonucleoside-diphosphate reductase alpha chain
LTELNVSDIEDEEDFNERLIAATFIGTLQASYTDFWYLRPEWRRRAEEDALLGVSLTGLAGKPDWLDLEGAAKIVKEWNQHFARKIGINPAKRLTTVKPSGTTSLVLGTSSGIHPWYAPYYIRRMQLFKNEALYGYVKNKVPELVEDHYLRPDDTGVLSIPIKAPDNAVFRDEGALGTLKRVKEVQASWIEGGHNHGLNKHNVSCTVNVKEDEWDEVKEWMWRERDNYAGISLLPFDTGTYMQAPFEKIDEATYEALSKYVTEIDLTEIQEEEDQTDLAGEVACGGGQCEISTV